MRRDVGGASWGTRFRVVWRARGSRHVPVNQISPFLKSLVPSIFREKREDHTNFGFKTEKHRKRRFEFDSISEYPRQLFAEKKNYLEA